MQQGSFDINEYFPSGSADLGKIGSGLEREIFTDSEVSQIANRLLGELGAIRDSLKFSNRLAMFFGVVTVIAMILTLIGIIYRC